MSKNRNRNRRHVTRWGDRTEPTRQEVRAREKQEEVEPTPVRSAASNKTRPKKPYGIYFKLNMVIPAYLEPLIGRGYYRWYKTRAARDEALAKLRHKAGALDHLYPVDLE